LPYRRASGTQSAQPGPDVLLDFLIGDLERMLRLSIRIRDIAIVLPTSEFMRLAAKLREFLGNPPLVILVQGQNQIRRRKHRPVELACNMGRQIQTTVGSYFQSESIGAMTNQGRYAGRFDGQARATKFPVEQHLDQRAAADVPRTNNKKTIDHALG